MMTALACLTAAIYFEARNQPIVGQYAVAEVVMNRVEDPGHPDDVCAVVKQGYERGDHLCQFSFYCDGKPETMDEPLARRQAEAIATAMLDDRTDFTMGAHFYHVDGLKIRWTRGLEALIVIGDHRFYTYKRKEGE